MARSAQRQQETIDAFEALLTEFRAVNPDSAPAGAAAGNPKRGIVSSRAGIVEAWAHTVLELDGAGPQSRRWGRSLRERLLAESEGSSRSGPRVREMPDEPDLEKRLARFPDFGRHAGTVSQWARAGESPEAAATGETLSGPEAAALARAWRRTLPGLRGLKAWRFLEHLGYPVLPPEAPVQRLLFRFGELEKSASRGEGGGARLTSTLQELSRLSGIEASRLRLLLRWAARDLPPYRGGGWCAVRPGCARCPLQPGCLWARFRGGDGSAGSASPRNETALKEQTKRLKSLPVEELSDAEVLALAIGGGRSDPRTVDTASVLLRRIGELPELEKSDAAELERARGIGRGTARQIKAALELGRRISTRTLKQGSKLQGSEDVWAAYGRMFRHISQEHFIVLMLDTKNRFIAHRIVSRGTLDSSAAHPREVFRDAIRASASAVILMHNHPSGDPQPSPEDRAVTRQLVEAGAILGIRVLDHIILGDERYVSLRDSGEM